MKFIAVFFIKSMSIILDIKFYQDMIYEESDRRYQNNDEKLNTVQSESRERISSILIVKVLG